MLKIYTLNVRGNVLFLDHPNESGDDSVRSSWGKLFETSSWTIASIDMENNSNSSIAAINPGAKAPGSWVCLPGIEL